MYAAECPHFHHFIPGDEIYMAILGSVFLTKRTTRNPHSLGRGTGIFCLVARVIRLLLMAGDYILVVTVGVDVLVWETQIPDLFS